MLAIFLIFGGLGAVGLAYSPVGKALADRIRHGTQPPILDSDPAVWEELDRLRGEMTELQERLDFAERMLAKGTEAIRADIAAPEN